MRAHKSVCEVGAAIDAVDEQIVKLLAERRRWAALAAELERGERVARVPARTEQVIARVRTLGEREGIEPDLVEALYREMIAGFVQLERAAG